MIAPRVLTRTRSIGVQTSHAWAVVVLGLVLCASHAFGAVLPHLLKDIAPGSARSDPKAFCAFDNLLYFQAADTASGAELWRTDTTEAGTSLFLNVAPDRSSVKSASPESLTVYNGKLYFSADDGLNGRDLYSTTGAGGNLVRLNVYPGHDAHPVNLVVANGLLFFVAERDGTGVEIGFTDGSAVSTLDLNPGATGSFPADLTALNGNLYFTADDGVHGREVWRTNGSNTALLADIQPGPASSAPGSLTAFGGALYFAADDGLNGSQLWKSDGTPGSAAILRILTGTGDFALPSRMTGVGTTLFLASRGDDAGAPTGMELWDTDGTPGLLNLVRDILPGAEGSNPAHLTPFGSLLVFAATDGAFNNEVWTASSAAADAQLLKEINPGTDGSQPGPFFEYKGLLYFPAKTNAEGRELWTSDGTSLNTQLLMDMNPGTANSNPEGLTVSRGRIVFAATAAGTGREPWVLELDQAPVITILGSSTVNLECSSEYVDPGATAQDDIDGNISSHIVTVNTVNAFAPGDYTVTYRVTDSSGHAAVPQVRTVHVADTLAPVISLTGPSTVEVPCHGVYVEPGATAVDNCDTSLPAVTIDAGAVNTMLEGTYAVTYNLSDASGNAALQVVRQVVVGACPLQFLSADENHDNRINLSELLRVIQFFNSDGYHCQAGSEDGYAPGPGDHGCAPHSSDYNPQDWRVDLSELLRLIQFFNSDGYHACAGSEDGYCPGP